MMFRKNEYKNLSFKISIRLFLYFLLLFQIVIVKGQTEIINLSGNVCPNSSILFTVQNDSSQNIPLNIIDSGSVNLFDDSFSEVISIGFNFEFFGNTYDNLLISSNNLITFDTSLAGGYSNWQITEGIPSNTMTTNSIMLPFQDLNPTLSSSSKIRWATVGQAPNRVFIVAYDSVPMFLCDSLYFTNQVHLYETCNIIETHILEKGLCSDWNDGLSIHGLQNIDATQAIVVGNRNFPNQWSSYNDGIRFTPDGTSNYIVDSIPISFINLNNPTLNILNQYLYDWYIDGNYIVTSDTASLSFSQNGILTAEFSQSNSCIFPFDFQFTDSIFLSNASFNYSDTIFCVNGGQVPISDIEFYGFFSSNPVGLDINSTNGIINTDNSTTGNYIIYNEVANPCVLIDSVSISILKDSVFLNYSDTIFCDNNQVIFPDYFPLSNVSFGSNIVLVDPLLGYIDLQSMNGNYEVYITMQSNCSDTSFFNFSVSEIIDIQIDSVFTVCQGESVQVNFNPNYNYQWSPSVGLSDSLSSSPLIDISQSQIYSVSIENDLSCYIEKNIFFNVVNNCGLQFYSAFTPNNDNINDTWRIDGLPDGNHSVKIINRWGDLVWQTDAYHSLNNAWNGKNSSGEELPEGVYFYIVSINTQEYKGFIELTR